MLAWFVRYVRWLSFVLPFTVARAALAQEGANVVVVDVRESARALDADALRAAIGAELHAEAIPPSDARASGAGVITIEADHEKREVSVRYDGRGEPILRRIPLLADAGAARQSVALIAGNLARDEASELASQLRDQTADQTRSASAGANVERPAQQPKPLPPQESKPRPDAEIRIEALVGLTWSLRDETQHTASGGGLVSFRYKSVLLAPSVTWGTAMFDQTQRDLRIGLGGSFALPRAPRAQWQSQVEVLGVGGVHEYRGFGANPWSAGANRDRAFLGMWAGFSANFLKYLTGGVFLFYEGDLSRAKATAPVSLPVLFGDGASQTTFNLGQDSIGLMMRFGASFSL